MSKKYRIWEQHRLNYVTCTIVGWTDVFTRPRYRDILIDSWKYCQQAKGFHVVAYVIMSNHFHLIGWVDANQTPNQTLSTVLRDMKRHTAKQMIKSIQTEPESRREWMLRLFAWYAKKNRKQQQHQVWAEGNHPIALWSPQVIWQKIRYIHNNPMRQRLVHQPEDYVYSSAGDYVGVKGMIDLDIPELIEGI